MNEATRVWKPGAALDLAFDTNVAPHERQPRIAMMGEFSAGKTTLINLLLGEELLPTRVTATLLPPVWMTYGPRAAAYVDIHGGQHEIAFDEIDGLPLDEVRYIKLFLDSEILREFDFIDTPGISDPNTPDRFRAEMVEYVDAVIWCTHATQAWRESERSLWVTIPEKQQANSILLATRSDKLAERDRARVHARLRREAGTSFRDIIMFSAVDAARACEMDQGQDLFASSGGEALINTLRAIARDLKPAINGIDGASESASAVILPMPVAVVRPRRVRSLENADPARVHAADVVAIAASPAAEHAPGQDALSDVLNLSQYLVSPQTEAAPVDVAAERIAATDRPDTHAAREEEDVSDILGDLRAASQHAETVDFTEDEADAVSTAGEEWISVRALWHETLAEAEVATVPDLLETLDRFFSELDRRGFGVGA